MGTTPLVSTQLPTADGERRLYRSEGVPDSGVRKVIYVNGMCTTPDTHRSTCWLLSEITESNVLGVYNLTGTTGLPQGAFLTDLLQCLIDKATLFGLVAKGLSAQWSGLPPEEKRGYMRRCLSLNLATQSLFDQLLDEGTGRPVVIVCHSQGNLITGNALNALSWVQGGSLHFIKCFCVASPAIFWPGGTSSQFFTNTDDLVPFGSFGLNLFRDKKWSRQSGANLNAPYVAPDIFMDAHDIKRYLCQPDFVSAIRKVLGLSDTFPTAPLATPGALPGQPGTYVIKPGDTLATIALQFYGNASRWRRIYDNKENQKKIGSNPNVIFPGQVLLIP